MTSLRSAANALFSKQSFKLVELDFDGAPKLAGAIFECDAVINETYSKSLAVTTYPVEDGTDIAESARVNNFIYSLSGITSDASMSYFNLLEDVASSSLGQLFGAASKSQRAFDQLNKWMDAGQPLQLITKFKKDGYKTAQNKVLPFVIESLTIPRDKDLGSALRYSITLRSINLVTINQASLLDVAFGIADKGAKQLTSNNASSAVNGGGSAARTQAALRDRAVQTGPISSILQGL